MFRYFHKACPDGKKPSHIFGSLIDHVYIKKAFLEEFFTNVTVENIYDAVRIVIQ